MDNYDKIAQDLKQTIDDYKQNLEYLKDRFADIGNIINQLDQMKQQIQNSTTKEEEFLTQISSLELKFAELINKLNAVFEDYKSALIKLNTQLCELTKSIEGFGIDANSSISNLRTDYKEILNEALATIAQQANRDASSLNQFLQQFSEVLIADIDQAKQGIVNNIIQSLGDSSIQLTNLIRELHSTSEDHTEKVKDTLIEKIIEHARQLEQKMESVELLTVQKVDELRNVVTKELKTNRKITIAGFIIILVIIIGFAVF